MKWLLKNCTLLFRAVWSRLSGWRQRLNARMQNRITPHRLALAATAFSALLLCVLLFVPSYIGVANDGTVSETMRTVGLAYLSDTVDDNYNNYFVRVYQNVYPENGTLTAHILLLRLARVLDYLFTRDTLFDVRFLALIYSVLYLPGVYLVVRAALERLDYFSESIFTVGAGVLIFADGSCTAYFNSLYPEALIFICLLYIVGGAMLLQKKTRFSPIGMALVTFWGVVLCLTRRHCFSVGLWLAVLCVLLMRVCEESRARIGLAAAAGILMASTVASLALMPYEFTDTSKIHAMTRGVLLEASDPEAALDWFDINGSYAMLADVSLYDTYALTEEENCYLQNGFLNRYSIAQIGLYYLSHPQSAVAMLDIGIKSSFDMARYYCGNYEKSAGMPARAQNIFCTMWSIFKQRSAPKTIGYLVILIAAYCIMAGRKTFSAGKTPERFSFVYFVTMLAVTGIGLTDLCYVILQSGDAQLTQYNFVMGICMDVLFYFVFVEILCKLNILEKGKKVAAS